MDPKQKNLYYRGISSNAFQSSEFDTYYEI